ncbi:MAG: S8 family serine peptidase [Solirubrobacteraceae bacterium]
MTPRWLTSIAVTAGFAVLAAPAGAAAPTDPQAAGQQPLKILRIPEAIDRAGPLADVPVLVADTGLDLANPDLQPRLFSLPAAVPAPDPEGVGNLPQVAAGASGWDLIGTLAEPNLVPDADPSDPPAPAGGHGTAVAGVLGAAWNNGQGGAGVAPNARFIALRTCWANDDCFQFVQAAAIDWAAARGARVISFSWLSGDGPASLEPGLRTAITSHPNVLFATIPSGNGGPDDADPNHPQPCDVASDNVLCVSTSAPNDGLDCGAVGATTVDVAVPTQNSVTTVNGGGFGPTGCATSFASPTAAGVATILFGIDPKATASDVRAAIIDSARKVPAWAGKSVSGGVVDAACAVSLFRQRRGLPDPGGCGGTTSDRTAPAFSVRRSGTTLSLTVSEPARLRVAVEQARTGRRVGRRCLAPTRANRAKPRCTRWAGVASLTRSVRKGTTRVKLPVRDAKGRRLPRGTYRAAVTATDAAGNRSAVRRVGFTCAAACR